jgi:hypothetical protein
MTSAMATARSCSWSAMTSPRSRSFASLAAVGARRPSSRWRQALHTIRCVSQPSQPAEMATEKSGLSRCGTPRAGVRSLVRPDAEDLGRRQRRLPLCVEDLRLLGPEVSGEGVARSQGEANDGTWVEVSASMVGLACSPRKKRSLT